MMTVSGPSSTSTTKQTEMFSDGLQKLEKANHLDMPISMICHASQLLMMTVP